MSASTAFYSDVVHEHGPKKSPVKHVVSNKKSACLKKTDWEKRVSELMKAFEGKDMPAQSGKPGGFLR